MAEPNFTPGGKRYRSYWWYFLLTVTIAAGICALVGVIYLLSATVPAVLGYIGYGLGALIFLALVALIPWIGQSRRD